jgi:hypothetical protein
VICEALGGRSAVTGRIVCDGLADGPRDLDGRSEIATRTTSTAPQKTNGAWPPREQSGNPDGQSDKPTPTEKLNSMDRKKASQELVTKTTNN